MTDTQDQWAQVEIFGHRQHWGRILEVERFGATLIRIDIPTEDAEIFESVFYGGGAIFSVTPCTEEAARAWAERQRKWNAPKPISRLPPPDSQNELRDDSDLRRVFDDDDDEDEEEISEFADQSTIVDDPGM